MDKEKKELKCPTINCEGKEFKLENVKPENFPIVNEKADIINGKAEYTYRCLTCQKIFISNIAPKNKKLLLG